jgi:hypothetical protein
MMLVGYNHNVCYRGDIFHIQTEDSGISNPHIITLLYRGGTILASKKTSYADIIKIENLEQVVEELMKEQHKEMLRRLKAGEFDSRAFPGLPPAPAREPSPPKGTEQAPAAAPVPPPQAAPPPAAAAPPPPPRRAEVVPQEGRTSTLDEIILDYLLTDDADR